MTIFCATDFSVSSRTATRLAAGLARRRGETLLLFTVVEPMPIDSGMATVATAAWEAERVTTAEAEIALAAQELRAGGLSVETRVAQGFAAGAILAAARAPGISLVVVGSHGRRGATRLLLGSCAEKVALSAPCPVLVARDPGAGLGRWDAAGPLRLALASDGSRATGAVFFWARTAAPTSPADVTLVRVYWPPQEGGRYGIDDPWRGNDGSPELVELVTRDLRRDAEPLIGTREPSIRLRVALRSGGEELAEAAPELGVDALVVGIPKRRFGHWTPLDPRSLLRAAKLPVFCVPEGIEPAERRIPRFRSVLIATDLSDVSRQAILPAYGLLAGGGQAHLCFVHEQEPAAPRPMPLGLSLSERERAALEAELRAQVPAEAADRGIASHVAVLEGPSVATEILQAAERLDVDAVAVASHGRSGLGRLLIGSVAEEVARRSRRPLLLIRAQAPAVRG